MLARGATSVYVCSRCRRTLAGISLNNSATANPANSRVIRCWQSSAARAVALEEVDYSHNSNEPEIPAEGQPQTEQLHRSRSRNRNRWRKWSPKPTADLGVNSLGKPAEVLLLPSRDRKIPQVPKGDEKEKSGASLQEFIDSEKVPLSYAKLAENIQLVRSQLGKMRGQLEKHEWKTLKKSLHSGFQTAQLKRYIEKKKKTPVSPVTFSTKKDEIIRYLVEEIWGFIIPAREEQSAPPARRAKVKKFSYSLQGDPAKLDLLLRHPSQPLKRIAEDCDVQINVYPSEARITTEGPSNDSNRALQRIIRYTKDQLGSVTIRLQGPLAIAGQDRDWKDYLHSYLKSLQQKYERLSIHRDDEKITLAYLMSPRVADQARREIMLSTPPNARMESPTVWPPENEPSTSLQLFPTPPELPPVLHRHPWLRLVSNLATPRSADLVHRNAYLHQLFQSLRSTFVLSSAGGNVVSRQNLYYDLTVKFGHDLVQNIPLSIGTSRKEVIDVGGHSGITLKASESTEVKAQDNSNEPAASTTATTKPLTEVTADAVVVADKDDVGKVPPSSTPPKVQKRRVFVGGAPFLAQRLTTFDTWVRGSSEQSDISETARAILRLELSPNSTAGSKRSPIFEIFVIASEAVDGERPQLKIARVTAIYTEKHFTVSCPQNDVDLNFTQQLKQDLLFPGSAKPAILTSLINAFRGYIAHAQTTGSSDWVFLPFATLPIPGVLRNTDAYFHHAAGKSIPVQQEEGTESADQRLEYLLRTVDVIDVDSRVVPAPSSENMSEKHNASRPNYSLDHITYTGADNTRQELRLAQTPLLSASTLTQPHLPTFLKTALRLAEQLSGNPLKPTSQRHSIVTDIDENYVGIEGFKPRLIRGDQPAKKKKKKQKKVALEAAVPASEKAAKPFEDGTTMPKLEAAERLAEEEQRQEFKNVVVSTGAKSEKPFEDPKALAKTAPRSAEKPVAQKKQKQASKKTSKKATGVLAKGKPEAETLKSKVEPRTQPKANPAKVMEKSEHRKEPASKSKRVTIGPAKTEAHKAPKSAQQKQKKKGQAGDEVKTETEAKSKPKRD